MFTKIAQLLFLLTPFVRATYAYVHYFPTADGDAGIRLAFAPFGNIFDISFQHFSGFRKITTGTRIVRMLLEHQSHSSVTSRDTLAVCGMLTSPLSAPSIRRRIRLPSVLTVINVVDVINLANAKDCKNAWGTGPLANRAAPAGAGVVNPPAPDPPASDPPAPDPPVPDPPSPEPQAPSVIADSAADPGHVLPPSFDISPPPSSESSEAKEEGSQDPVTSQVLLFSESEASFGDFSQETSPPVPYPSPSISSFTDTSDASQGILKNVPIVSSDPVVVE